MSSQELLAVSRRGKRSEGDREILTTSTVFSVKLGRLLTRKPGTSSTVTNLGSSILMSSTHYTDHPFIKINE